MFDHCLYFNLSALTRKINFIWEIEFKKLGLSPSQGYLLYAIAENPKISQKELSNLMVLEPSTITRFVDNLVTQRLVEKSCKGKGAALTATPEGQKKYREIKRAMNTLFEKMQSQFGKSLFKKFVRDLNSARNTLAE